MKLYIDWNVLNRIKNGDFKEFDKIIRQTERFVVVYSTAHISDISASYSENKENPEIQSDLEFISEITDDLCVFNNGEKIVIRQNDPFHLFESEIESKSLLKDFSIDKLFNIMEAEGITAEFVSPIKALLKSMPVDKVFNDAFENPQSSEMMNLMFPGLKDSSNFEDIFTSMGKIFENLNEKEGYKHLKTPFKHLNINQGKLTNPDNNPFEILIEAYKKLGIEESPLEKDYYEKGKNAPVWFDDITSAYINLDMHGFYSDEVKVTETNKKTFKNTTQDSFHTAFASTCDFYITNDKKNYQKAKAIFKEKNIFTHVFKPHEFINFYNENLEKVDFITSWNKFNEILKSGNFYDISDQTNPDDYFKVHLSTFYFFGYFNKISLFNSDTNKNSYSIMFGKELPTNCLGVFYKEIKTMVNLIVDKLGNDINNRGHFDESEIDENNYWEGRTWIFGEFQFRLVQYNRYFQFYYDINLDQKELF